MSSNLTTAPHWYALYTRARFEKAVAKQLTQKGVDTYLPLQKTLRHWHDRKKWVEEPLFRSYVFVRMVYRDRMLALETDGIVRLVSFHGKPAIVRDFHIENLRRLLSTPEPLNVEVVGQFALGEFVKVNYGPLHGMVGELVEIRNEKRFLLRFKEIQQAIAVEIPIHWLEKVGAAESSGSHPQSVDGRPAHRKPHRL